MKEIPKIIHQTWKDSNIPTHLLPFAESWKQYHSDWEYCLWTDAMNRDFICNHAPDFVEVYDSYENNIQRVDAVRYFILYEIGGLFIDLDFLCLQNIECLLEDSNCVFGVEPIEHAQRFKKEIIICNAFMACNPKNEFLKKICDQLSAGYVPLNRDSSLIIDVLNSTGPFMLTSIYNTWEGKHKIKLLRDSIYPLSIAESRNLIKNHIDQNLKSKIDSAYAIHFFLGSWIE
jgi:mannosyltransferase OCH1-like enzyme